MAANTLSVLKPSVNNLSARIFVRAAGLEFEEVDVWGKKGTPEFLAKDPADLTPLLEEEGLPQGSLWESCAIMQYLCNKHGLTQLYPTDPAERAMVDSAMFYLIGTLYPLVARATYPSLGFPQYAGEVGSSAADDGLKTQAQRDATEALARPLEVYREFFLERQEVRRRRLALDRRHPSRRHARVPRRHRLRAPVVGHRVHEGDGGCPRRRVLGAGGRCSRLRGIDQVIGGVTGSGPHRENNLLDRLSRRPTLEVHYRQMMRRERALLARYLPLAGGDVLSVGAGWLPGRHLFPRRPSGSSPSTPTPTGSPG